MGDRAPRILIIPDYDKSGGTLNFLMKLLKFHQKQELETAVLIPERQIFAHVLKAFQAAQVRVYTAPGRGKLLYKPYCSLLYDLAFCWTAYWAFLPDLIVVSTGAFDLMLGVLAYPVPVIFAMHTYPPPEIGNKKRIGMRLFVRLMCCFAKNRFLTVSKFAANNIHKYLGVPTHSLKVVYNSYQDTKIEAGRHKPEMILTVGHVAWYKNPERWLEVAREVLANRPDVRFVWLGDGPSLDSLRQSVHDLGLEEHIALQGYSSCVDEYYAEAMIYFQPSLIESHGTAVVEAMAHGLPCVTSNAGGLPESVVEGETGFLCAPEDVDGLSSRLIELLDNPALREHLGRAGQRRARALFSETIQEQEIMDLYKTLLGQKWPIGI